MKRKGLLRGVLSLFVLFTFNCCSPVSTNLEGITPEQDQPTRTLRSTVQPVAPSFSTETPTATISLSPSSTDTPTATVSPTITVTPLDTLDPIQVNETIKNQLVKPDCTAPCFWGIIPAKTSIEEVNTLFMHLGFSPVHPYETIGYKTTVNKKMGVAITFALESNIVQSTNVIIYDNDRSNVSGAIPLAYYPVNVIRQYGRPSRVEIYLNLGSFVQYDLLLYYDDYHLIVHSRSSKNLGAGTPLTICPAVDPYDAFFIYMGKNPIHPPESGVPIEQASALSVDDFTKLMTTEPGKACFPIDANAFLHN